MSERKKIKRVSITPGCTTCGLCAFVAPEVFEVTDIAHVKQGADPNNYAERVREAAQACPVNVIKIEDEE